MERNLAFGRTLLRGSLSMSQAAATFAALTWIHHGVAQRRGSSEIREHGLEGWSIDLLADRMLAGVFSVARIREDLSSSFLFSLRSLLCFSNEDEVGVRASSSEASSDRSVDSSDRSVDGRDDRVFSLQIVDGRELRVESPTRDKEGAGNNTGGRGNGL